MTKELSIIAAAALAWAGSIQAQTPAAPATAPSHTITVTGAAASDYMWRGLRLSGAAFQPAVELGAGNAVLGVWGSFPFDSKKVPDSSDPEIDIYGGYTFAFNEVTSIVPGFTAYIYPKAPTNAGWYRSTFEPNVALNYTISGLKLTPKVYYDFITKGATAELNAFYAVPLAGLGSELDFTAQVGTYKWNDFANDSNPRTKVWGDYWMAGVAMPFQVTPIDKIVIGYSYAEGRNAFVKQGTAGKTVNGGAIGRGFATLSYSHTF